MPNSSTFSKTDSDCDFGTGSSFKCKSGLRFNDSGCVLLFGFYCNSRHSNTPFRLLEFCFAFKGKETLGFFPQLKNGSLFIFCLC